MRSPRGISPILPWWAVAALSFSSGVAQTPAIEPVLELPTYNVTAEWELPPPEAWYYARIPGFEVISNASDAKTRDFLGEFQRFIHAVNLVWSDVAAPEAAPASLILCGSGDKFRAFLPAAAPGAEQATVTLTFRAREQAAMVLDLQTDVLNLQTREGPGRIFMTAQGDSVGSNENPGVAVDPYRQVKREYIRFLLAGRESPAPAWFTEGLAQIFMAMEITDTSITLGKLVDPNVVPEERADRRKAPEEDSDFNAALAKSALLPLAEMFAVTSESTEARNPLGQAWAKQCYAFVHWCLYGDQGVHQKGLFIFLTRLEREPPSEALFQECFKESYPAMLQSLRNYIEFTRHKVAGVKAEKGLKLPLPPAPSVRPATQAEVGRLKGEAFALAGQPGLARTELITAYRRGERDPALLAALGLAELTAGDQLRARKLLEAAFAAKASRPRAGLELARLRLADALAQSQGGSDRLNPAQTAQVLEPLFAAGHQLPALPEIYGLMAETWARSALSPTASQLAVIEQGVKLFPRNAALVYRAAELRGKNGFPNEAHSLVRLGLRIAPDAATRTRFEQLRASLPPMQMAPTKG